MNWYECNWSCLDAMCTPPHAARPGNTIDRLTDRGEAIEVARCPTGRPPLGLHSGQIVLGELAVAVPLLAAVSGQPLWLPAGAATGIALGIVGFARWRRRWLHEWLGVGLLYLARPRALPSSAGPGRRQPSSAEPGRRQPSSAEPGRRQPSSAGPSRPDAADLLALLDPSAQVAGAELDGAEVGVVEDQHGLATVLELGEAGTLLADAVPRVPLPAALLPHAGTPDGARPRIQLLIAARPAPALGTGTGAVATSYRQLTEDGLPAQLRAFVAVRVDRDHPARPDSDLRRALSSTLRRVRQRLDQERVPHRPLGVAATLAAVAELAQQRPGLPMRESWVGIAVGGLCQASLRLSQLHPEMARQLLTRLPATAVTVSLSAGRDGTEVLIRLTAPGGTGLSTAVRALRRLLGPVPVTHLDGQQLDGLAATLPLARLGPGRPERFDNLAGPGVELPAAGLMIGRNRHGGPVTVRLLRPEPTRAVLVGSVRAAQLLTLRALALGGPVVIQSARPYAWEPFLHAVGLPDDAIRLTPPGRPVLLPPAGALAPQLIVVDVGAIAGDQPAADGAWRTMLVLREELATTDVDELARADLVILQPLAAEQAALAGAGLGLGADQEWLTRIRADMVGVVNRRTVRWATLSATAIEQQMIGVPDRVPTA
jgi:type VII secretion protein EccE